MANEFKVKNGLFVDQGGAIITGSVIATGGFTGSLQGTASFATTASQAISASYASNGGVTQIIAGTNVTISPTNGLGAVTINSSGGGGSTFPYTGSAIISGSLVITGSLQVGVPGANNPRIDTGPGTLSRGDLVSVDWIQKQLYDSSTALGLDWESRALYDSTGATSADWNARILYEPTVTWESLNYSNDSYIDSQLYYRNIIPGQVQRAVADAPASKYGGQVIQATVDGAVTDFQLVYLDIDGIWYALKNLTVVSTKMVGICVDVAGGYVLVEGDIGVSDDSSQGAVVTGADHGLPVYISSTTGEMTTTAPASGVIRILGHIYYQSTTDANWWTMKFRPSNDWYEI